METFRSFSWQVPLDIETDFATSEQFKSTSVTYKILHGSFKEVSSDSSDEPSPTLAVVKKKTKKKKNTKKKSQIKSSKDDNQSTISNIVEETCINEGGVRWSSFSAAQHASYVEMLQAMQNQMTNIPPMWMEMKQAVEIEQSQFLEYIKDLWKTTYEKHNILSDDAKRYTEDEWKLQLKRVKSYPRFYKREKKIPIVYSTDKPEVQMIPLEVLLEMGIVPKLHTPNNMPTKLSTEYSKMLLLNAPAAQDAHSLHRIPVSLDKNAEILAVKERAHIVISSSSLKCIADNASSKFDKVWNIPVIVKQYNVKDGSTSKSQKVVYIDKKLPAKSMSASERNDWFHKLAVKTFMCHHKDPNAFRYPENHHINCNVEFSNEEESALLQNCSKDISKESLCKHCNLPTHRTEKRKHVQEFAMDDDSDSSGLMIDTDNEDISNPLSDICTCGKGNRKIHEVGDNISDTNEYTVIPPSSKTNMTYRLWKLYCEERSKEDLNEKFLKGQNSYKELRVLVRCKMDACENENNNIIPVCVSSKMEYQAEYGAEKVNLSPLVREWVALFFRPEAGLRRIRINVVTEDVIMTEKLVLRDLALMASHLYNLRIRRTVLGSLYQVMSDLVNLNPGNYMLSHDVRDGPFACIFQQTNEYSSYDLYADYESVNPGVITRDETPQWIPIDTNLITPHHIITKQIPATFQRHN